MQLTWLDWAAIAGYLLITIIMGLYFRSRSGSSMEEYFVSGRSVSWWLAGTSMVATTFLRTRRCWSQVWFTRKASPATGCGGHFSFRE